MHAGMTGNIVVPIAFIGLLLALIMPIFVTSTFLANSGDRDRIASRVIATLLLGWLLNAGIAGMFFFIGFLIATSGQWAP